MSRLVLDTNCLIQIVSPRSKYHSLWDHHYDVLKTIPFPKVEVVSLVDFLLLKKV